MAVGSNASDVWTVGSSDGKNFVMARKPQDKYKIQAPSLHEIAAAFDQVHGVYRSRVGFQRSVLTRGALVNAMTLHFLSLDPEVQRRIIEAGVAKYESLLDSDEEVADWRLSGETVAEIHASAIPDSVEPAGAKVGKVKADRKRAN